MNKLLKYILKGKREEVSVPVVIGRVILLLMLGCFVFIVSYLCFLYIEGEREQEAYEYFNQKNEPDEEFQLTSYKSILPKELNDALVNWSPKWFRNKTNIFHYRYRSLKIRYAKLNKEDIETISSFRYLEQLIIVFSEIPDLTFLKSMNINGLTLTSSDIYDLSPLRGMTLEYLTIPRNRVNDLSPLKGMPLKFLYIGSNNIKDLSPLTGMPLKNLNMNGCKEIKDLKPLAGMPLQFIEMGGCDNVDDLSPLIECDNLLAVFLPSHTKDKDVEFLKKLPYLQQIWRYKGICPQKIWDRKWDQQ